MGLPVRGGLPLEDVFLNSLPTGSSSALAMSAAVLARGVEFPFSVWLMQPIDRPVRCTISNCVKPSSLRLVCMGLIMAVTSLE